MKFNLIHYETLKTHTCISGIGIPSRIQVTIVLSPFATQSNVTVSPSMAVLLTGGIASRVSPATVVGNGDTPTLNDFTSLLEFRLISSSGVKIYLFFCY